MEAMAALVNARIRAVFINDMGQSRCPWILTFSYPWRRGPARADKPYQRDLIDHGQLHHHHPRNPEKQNPAP